MSDPAIQSSTENFVKNETEKNVDTQGNTNFTGKSSESLSETDLAIIDAQVANMKQISEKEEERFKALLENENEDEPTNKQKGNYGEIKSCLNLLTSEELKKGVNGKRYNLKRIGDDAPDSLDSKIRHGIDGIYENLTPVPDFVIDETKYGTSTLSETRGTGPQMGKDWILYRIETLYRKRIISKVQYKKILDAFKNNSVDAIISHVSQDGATIRTQKISLKSNCSKAETTNDFVFSDWP